MSDERTLSLLDATTAKLIIVVDERGMAQITPGKGVTPEYVARYLKALAEKFDPTVERKPVEP